MLPSILWRGQLKAREPPFPGANTRKHMFEAGNYTFKCGVSYIPVCCLVVILLMSWYLRLTLTHQNFKKNNQKTPFLYAWEKTPTIISSSIFALNSHHLKNPLGLWFRSMWATWTTKPVNDILVQNDSKWDHDFFMTGSWFHGVP